MGTAASGASDGLRNFGRAAVVPMTNNLSAMVVASKAAGAKFSAENGAGLGGGNDKWAIENTEARHRLHDRSRPVEVRPPKETSGLRSGIP